MIGKVWREQWLASSRIWIGEPCGGTDSDTEIQTRRWKRWHCWAGEKKTLTINVQVGFLSVFILSSNVCIFWLRPGCRDFSTERPYHRALSFVIVDIAFVCLVTGLTSLKRKMWCLAYHVFGNCRIRMKSENSNLISKKRDTFISKFVLWIPWIINSN